MKCPKCNNEVKTESKFCPFCGSEIENVVNEKIENTEIAVKQEKTQRKIIFYIVVVIMIIVSSSLAVYFSIGYQYDHTITFDARGGTCSPTSVRYDGTNKNISFPTPEKENYVFLGWYTMVPHISVEDKITEKYFAEHSYAFGNTTLYAHWGQYQQIAINYYNYSQYLNISKMEFPSNTINSVTISINRVDYNLTRAEVLAGHGFMPNKISITVSCGGISKTKTLYGVGTLDFLFTDVYGYGGARITNITGSVEGVVAVD